MSDTPPPDNSKNLREDALSEDKLAEIRALIIGPEQAQLGKLQERLDRSEIFAKDVSRVLPEAVILRASQDKKFVTALTPTIEEVLKSSIKRDSKTLVSALFPVMGPAIRKAVTETLRRMLQSFNQALEKSLSWDGLKWRLEAIQTGKSFAEVVILHSLLYRVEQIFLIHKETGLLLQHVAEEDIAFQDADMVSGMLTAIQDFVHDSFDTQSEETIETIQMGERTVWITQGTEVVLAAAIRGTAPEELKSVFQEALENTLLEQGEALESFDGDTAHFEKSRYLLEACLQARYKTKKQKSSPFLWVLLGIIIITFGIWGFFSVRNHLRWSDYLKKIDAERGIVVTDTGKRDGQYFISGLRDPLAVDPVTLLGGSKLDSEKVISYWESYYSLHPDFIVPRAKKILRPPETVSLELKDSVLYATGQASHQWIAQARYLVQLIPGITEILEDSLSDIDLKKLLTSKDWIENQSLRFTWDSTRLVAGQSDTLRALVKEIKEFQDIARLLDKHFYIEIRGHTDNTGSEEHNLLLSRERAEIIRSVLIEEGLKAINYKTTGVGTREPLRQEATGKDRKYNRRVSFNIILADILTTEGN